MAVENPWEQKALDYRFAEDGSADRPHPAWEDGVHDATIYPGLYSASGLDIVNVLVRVYGRPSPKVELGSVDLSCSIMVCDLEKKDTPIIYVSDAFEELTGYKSKDVLGKNCRFLQAPGGTVKKGSVRDHVSKDTITKMKKAVEKNDEVQLEVDNFKKNGKQFVNFLTIIPIKWDEDDYKYAVGFQVER